MILVILDFRCFARGALTLTVKRSDGTLRKNGPIPRQGEQAAEEMQATQATQARQARQAGQAKEAN